LSAAVQGELPDAARPVEEFLDALARLAAIEQAVNAERTLLLAEAGYPGASWQQMAKACKVTKRTSPRISRRPTGSPGPAAAPVSMW
jgi:hypothetical protein